ncbi:MAG TPA: TIGR01906 family membrane protein [Anaerolineae bacterium]|nr:TIGR01906 family membrane protein [Anaerolineae bacterium]HQK13283.1 TIGR01906 family membrane protein [Anaerolineae bacterium]
MRVGLRVLIVIAVPLVLVMGTVRLLTLPWYPAWEYSKPGFPEDPLAMAPAERLRLARACIAFLNRPRGVVSLAELRFDDGTPAFNAREVGHMDDVKLVYDRLTTAAALACIVAAVAVWWLVRNGHAAVVWGALSDGGLVTLCLLVGLGVWMAVGFESFFTAFHGVFFESGTWLFDYSDTLIRLFPLQFWSDAGMLIAVAVACMAFALALLGRAVQKRGESRMENRE